MSYIKQFSYKEHAENTRNANQVLKDAGVTGPQMDVLRRAARPVNAVLRVTGDLQPVPDGEVCSYGVMQKSLDALTTGGFIGRGYKFTEQQRADMLTTANALIEGAHRSFVCESPFQLACGADVPVWRAVLIDLSTANAILKDRDIVITRITDKGRVLVAAFLASLGIKED